MDFKKKSYLVNGCTTLLVFTFIFFIWAKKIWLPLYSQLENVEKTIEVSRVKTQKILSFDKNEANIFFTNQFISSSELNGKLYQITKRHLGVILLSMSVSEEKNVPVEKALGADLTAYSHQYISEVKIIHYHMKIAGNYQALYNFLSDVYQLGPCTFWENISLTIAKYPKLVATLDFYIMDR